MSNINHVLFVFYCGWYVITAGDWHIMGETDFPMLDVGINSYNTSFSAEITPNGTSIVGSTDLGAHWAFFTNSGEGLLDAGVSSLSDQKAVVTSMYGRGVYTLDGGNTWRDSIGFIPGMQGLTRTKDKTQIYGGVDNDLVRISKDFGANWEAFPIGNLSFGGRYISMPTNLTWYITAGNWADQKKYDITGKIKYNMDTKKIEFGFEQHTFYKKNQRTLLQPDNKMFGAIYKTSDGGKTFVEQFFDEGNFYFNGIDCCDINTCYAVSEGDSGEGSNNPGSRVWLTTNGGIEWNMVLYNKGDGGSLLAVRCFGNGQEAYVGGGDIVSPGYRGYIFHTSDAGKTWSNFTGLGSVFAMDMNDDNTRGIAVGISRVETGITYGYY